MHSAYFDVMVPSGESKWIVYLELLTENGAVSCELRRPDQTTNSIPELVEKLLQDLANIKTPVWYRGQSNKAWPLIPLIYRRTNTISEIDLMRKFKQDATLLLNPRPLTPAEWLFVMRHNGVPTRLLDWTESPLVGTYFAVNDKEDKDDKKDAVLWVLLPSELNHEEGRDFGDYLPSFEEDMQKVMLAYNPVPENEVANPGKIIPIAFIAPRSVVRMQVQLSVFTIHHKLQVPIEDVEKGDMSGDILFLTLSRRNSGSSWYCWG